MLQGGFNNDIINGGAGNDTVIVLEGEFIDDVDGGVGIDTLDLSDMDGTGGPGGTSGAAIINLAAGTWDLTSGSGGARTIAGIEIVRGTQLGDTITGGAALEHLFGNGGDDMLSGVGPGADRLWGGLGNDTYIIEAGDQVHELAGEGIDTVQSSITYTLAANVENLILTGAGQPQRHRQRPGECHHRQRRQQLHQRQWRRRRYGARRSRRRPLSGRWRRYGDRECR